MKVRIADYDVEIKAKYRYNKKASKQATLGLINYLAVTFRAGSKYKYNLGCNAIGDEMKETANDMHKICEENGCYKNE